MHKQFHVLAAPRPVEMAPQPVECFGNSEVPCPGGSIDQSVRLEGGVPEVGIFLLTIVEMTIFLSSLI